MDDNLKDNLKSFLEKKDEEEKTSEDIVLISKADGLVERVDKTLVLNDGRQLLND